MEGGGSPSLETGGAPQDVTSHPSHPTSCSRSLPEAAWPPTIWPPQPAGPAPASRAPGEGGRHGQATVTPGGPGGAARGGRRGQEGVGWVGGRGAGKSQGEGQGGEQKVPLWSGREKRSALPNAQKPCW